MALTQPGFALAAPVLTRTGTLRAPRSRGGRRGVALLMVVCVLAVAGILAYALLASSALESESAAHSHASLRAELMAESGVSLAMHYLRHPEDSTVAPVKGAAGDYHYPGQSGILIDGDSFDVEVTNPQPARFLITAAGHATDADGSTIVRRLRVHVTGVGQWQAHGAVQLRTDVALAPGTSVEGDLVSSGKFDGGGDVTGKRRAANYTDYPSDSDWAAPPALPEQVVPPFSGLTLVRAATERAGVYVYNNARCQADYVGSDVLLSPPVPSAGNPGRVFIYDGILPLTLSGGSTNDFEGTLVVTRADLLIEQVWRFRPQSGMPGLLVYGTTSLVGLDAALEVEGVFYNRAGFGASVTQNSNPVIVRGTMLDGRENAFTLGLSISGPLKFIFDSTKAAVPNLTNQGIRYTRLQIEDWQRAN